ncbi:unnamed protein product [Danaus chrysippus]|uniref:(African queen) hypothetical protein n=1 Tax=Danaus chrysippus TaxID=151541 RepID=A0A8J2QC11_9NEOP|nr:unnamed protein product [Danaus chrysippus]
MGRKSYYGVFLVITLVANAVCLPTYAVRPRRQSDTNATTSEVSISKNNDITYPPSATNDDDDAGFDTSSQPSSGGGSSISSLLNLLGAFFPGSSSSAINKLQEIMHKMIKDLGNMKGMKKIIKRDVTNNEIDVDYKVKERLEEDDVSDSENNETSEEDNRNDSMEDSDSNIDSDEDYDDFPGGDGQGGGLLGLLAGLSGGGDGIDLNSLIASGLGLFVGLLSEGEENPGAVIASYLLTSLDTITGGGSKNNGKFFGIFLSKLVKGISASPREAPNSPGAPTQSSPLWTLKMDILRALLQFGSSVIGLASSAVFSSSSSFG